MAINLFLFSKHGSKLLLFLKKKKKELNVNIHNDILLALKAILTQYNV